ncbi:MAG: ubiquitin-like small modifier protein 1 [Myxococcota bacterium]
MRVSFYATLRPIVGGRSVEVPLDEGATVRELVDALASRWPGLSEQLFDEEGGLSRRVNVFVEGRDILWLDGVETPLQPGQKVDIFPPVAGG